MPSCLRLDRDQAARAGGSRDKNQHIICALEKLPQNQKGTNMLVAMMNKINKIFSKTGKKSEILVAALE